MGQRLLLRWAEQAWGATREALTVATKALSDLKKVAAQQVMGQHATRFLLEVDTVALTLLQVRHASVSTPKSRSSLLCLGMQLSFHDSCCSSHQAPAEIAPPKACKLEPQMSLCHTCLCGVLICLHELEDRKRGPQCSALSPDHWKNLEAGLLHG